MMIRRRIPRAVVLTATGLALVAGAAKLRAEDAKAAEPQKPQSAKTILILGGTGFLGPQIVEAAQKRGHTLTLFNRGKTNPQLFPEIEKLRGNRDGDLKALEGRKWDAVVDTSGYVPRIVRDSAELLEDSVKHYVFISTMSVYADNSKPGMDETTPVGKLEDETVEKITGETYGPLKALCEQAAEKAMPGRVTIIRPGLIVGPGDTSDRFTYWPVRIERGGEVLCPGSPSDPVQFIDVRDLAEWIVKIIEEGQMGVFNATGPDTALTIGELLESCREVSGGKAALTWVDAGFLSDHGVSPWSDMPVWVPAVGEDAGFARSNVSKAVSKGLKFRPHRATCKDTLDWFKTLAPDRQRVLRAGISPAREVEVLAAWKARDKNGTDKPPAGAQE